MVRATVRRRRVRYDARARQRQDDPFEIWTANGIPLRTHLNAMKGMGLAAQEHLRKQEQYRKGVRDVGFLTRLHDRWKVVKERVVPARPRPPDPPRDAYREFLMDTSGVLGTPAYRVGDPAYRDDYETKIPGFLSVPLERAAVIERGRRSYARTALLFRRPEAHTFGSDRTFCLAIIGGVVVDGPRRRRDAVADRFRGADPARNEAVFMVGLRADGCGGRGPLERVVIPSPRNRTDRYAEERAALGRDQAAVKRVVDAFNKLRRPARTNKAPDPDPLAGHSYFYDRLLALPWQTVG